MTNRETGIQTGSEFRKQVLCRIYEKPEHETFLTGDYSRWSYDKIRDGPIKDIEKFLADLRNRLDSNIASRTEELLKRGYIIKDIEGIKKAIDDEKNSIVRWVYKKCEELIPKWQPKWQKMRKGIKNEKTMERRKSPAAA